MSEQRLSESSGSRARPVVWSLAALAVLTALLFTASAASAANIHSFAGEFGVSGTGDGQFHMAHIDEHGTLVGGAVAVDQQSGDVYVADAGNHRVQKFDEDGNFIAAWGWGVADGLPTSEVCTSNCQAGIGGAGPGQLNYPAFLAVDNSGGPGQGDVYVSSGVFEGPGEPNPYWITKFAPDGTIISRSEGETSGLKFDNSIRGMATDPAGRVWVYDGRGYVREFRPDWTFVSQWKYGAGTIPALGIAVNSQLEVYLLGNLFSAGGQLLSSLPQLPAGESKIAVEPNSGDIYVARDGDVRRYDGLGSPKEPFFGQGHFDRAFQPAVRSSDLRVYVPNQPGDSIVYFDYVVVPDVLERPATNLDHESVTVNALVDPLGAGDATECVVEYGLDAQYGQTVPCEQPLPFSEPTEVSAQLSGLTTLAVYHYRFVISNAQGDSFGTDQVVVPPGVLDLSTDPATAITLTAAKLNGSLNPNGEPTTYHFEYGLDQSYGQSTPSVSAGEAPGVLAVPPVDVSGLGVGRTYHFRIVAENSFGTTYGADRTFTTQQPPSITGVTASNLTLESANLNARINPHDADTDYKFEFGTTLDYGESLPVPEGQLMANTGPQQVSVHVTELAQDVTYHYRVVASSDLGTTTTEDHTFSFTPPSCPNAAVRQQTGGAFLPDCRAYELVSPPNAGGIQLLPGTGAPSGSQNGGAVYVSPNSGLASSPPRFGFFGAFGQLAGTNAPNVLQDAYISTRSTTGWSTTFPGLPASQFLSSGNLRCNEEMSRCITFHLRDPFFGDETDNGSNAPYLTETDGTLLGRLPTNVGSVKNGEKFDGVAKMSPDFSHFAFSSRTIRFAEGGLVTAPGSVYDNDVGSGTVTVISKTPAGAPIPQSSANAGDKFEFMKIPAISRDGSHILMSTGTTPRCPVNPALGSCSAPGPVVLWMTVNASVSYEVSRGQPATLVGMTSSGSEVFYLSTHQLTPDDTDSSIDLFAWRAADDSITRVSAGAGAEPSVGNTDSCSAAWVSGCDVTAIDVGPDEQSVDNLTGQPHVSIDSPLASSDGAVLFYSPESLTGEKVNNQRNLYLFKNGTLRYVASLTPEDPVSRVQLTPDGGVAAFVTTSRLTSFDNAEYAEMYRYTAGDDRIVCVSCRPDGLPPTSDTEASANGHFMSDDGRIFFSTSDDLAVADSDGLRSVYEYVAGEPKLISSGTSVLDEIGLPSGLLGNFKQSVGLEAVSADGMDVYFSTFDSLVPQDRNGQFLKFYDARTNGGFAVPATGAPCAAADECHGVDSSPPTVAIQATGVDLGATGNGQKPKKRVKPRKRKRKAKRGHHRKRKAKQRHRKRQGSRAAKKRVRK